ncbi:hypothetical protein ACMZ5A_29040, partial [Bacillus mobilis]|uniref:hypothetical protein n=1 Tax=Bacillus mobilis TaxID=2026190 RepID=UPI0039EFA3F3
MTSSGATPRRRSIVRAVESSSVSIAISSVCSSTGSCAPRQASCTLDNVREENSLGLGFPSPASFR